jgi:hypothetical protein
MPVAAAQECNDLNAVTPTYYVASLQDAKQLDVMFVINLSHPGV